MSSFSNLPLVYVVGNRELREPNFIAQLEEVTKSRATICFYNGSKATATELFDAQKKYYLSSGGLLLTPGEFGAVSSHCNVYKKIIESNRPGIIFEDDFELKDSLTPKKLLELVNDLSDYEVLIMGGQDGIQVEFDADSINKIELNQGVKVWRAVAYTLNVNTAKMLLELQMSHLLRADDWTKFKLIRPELKISYINYFRHDSTPNPSMEKERDFINYSLKWHFFCILRLLYRALLGKVPGLKYLNEVIKRYK